MMQPNTLNVPTVISSTIGIALMPLLLLPLIAWLYAMRFDVLHASWGRFVVDAVLAPIGIIHGIILLFSN
jgi:hypothetical protein